MKKIIAFVVIVITLVSSQIVFAESGIVKTISSSINVRESPSTTSSIIGLLPQNTKVNTLEKIRNFYKINYKGKSGYVYSSFIKLGTAVNTSQGQNIPVLNYHRLTTDSKKVTSLTILKSAFNSQMNYLKTHGYNTISLEQLYNYKTNDAPIPNKSVVITFDDGYVSNYTIAYPILKANKQKATVFMIACDVDHYYDSLTSKELKIMDANNFKIENHTFSHDNLGSLSYAKQLATIIKARETLEKVLGRKEVYIAYPFGSYNSITKKACKAAGCRMGISTETGFTSTEDDLFTINRIYIDATISISSFAKKLS